MKTPPSYYASKQVKCLPVGIPFYNVGKIILDNSLSSYVCFDVSDEDATVLLLSGNYHMLSNNVDLRNFSKIWIDNLETEIKNHGINIRSWSN
jgi:hypothetical protein